MGSVFLINHIFFFSNIKEILSLKRVGNFSLLWSGRILFLDLIKIFENSECIICSMEHVLPGVQVVVQVPISNICSVSSGFFPIECWQIKFLEEILTNFLLF